MSRWRCIDLQAEVARRFDVSVDDATIGRWLRKLKMTRLQPRPYHPKKDADAQEAYKNVWPALPASDLFRHNLISLRQRIRSQGVTATLAKMEIRTSRSS